MEFNVIPTISPEKSGKNTFFKSAETINLVTSFVSPICKVTSKTAIQYNYIPVYLPARKTGGQFIIWLLSKCKVFHLYKITLIHSKHVIKSNLKNGTYR